LLGPKGVGQAATATIVGAYIFGGEEFIMLLSVLDAIDMPGGDL
jgi:hypothetical protein